jgi:hypothetical protein
MSMSFTDSVILIAVLLLLPKALENASFKSVAIGLGGIFLASFIGWAALVAVL